MEGEQIEKEENKFSAVLDNCDIDEAEEVCSQAVEDILNKTLGDVDVSEELQALCGKVVSENKSSQKLYKSICDTVTRYVTLNKLEKLLDQLEDGNFVKIVNVIWEDFYFHIHEINQIFTPLQEYCHSKELESVQVASLKIFRDELILTDNVLDYLQKNLKDQMERYRGGEFVLRSDIRKSCFMLKTLDFNEKHEKYAGKFEENFLKNCFEFYESQI